LVKEPEAKICRRCKTSISAYDVCTDFFKGDEYVDSSCSSCSSQERVEEFEKTKELRSRLMLDAALAMQHESYGDDFANVRPEIASFYRENIEVLRKVSDATERVRLVAKRFELMKWFGLSEKVANELVGYYREWGPSGENVSRVTDVKRRLFLRKLFVSPPLEDLPEPWRVFMEGRNPQNLQRLAANSGGLSAEVGSMKAMMLSTAGRTLLTCQDNGSGKFGGAWVTLIFDETSEYPRGGIQGFCATENEAVCLLYNAIELKVSSFSADAEVSVW